MCVIKIEFLSYTCRRRWCSLLNSLNSRYCFFSCIYSSGSTFFSFVFKSNWVVYKFCVRCQYLNLNINRGCFFENTDHILSLKCISKNTLRVKWKPMQSWEKKKHVIMVTTLFRPCQDIEIPSFMIFFEAYIITKKGIVTTCYTPVKCFTENTSWSKLYVYQLCLSCYSVIDSFQTVNPDHLLQYMVKFNTMEKGYDWQVIIWHCKYERKLTFLLT